MNNTINISTEKSLPKLPLIFPVAKMVKNYPQVFAKIRKENIPGFITVNGQPIIVALSIEKYEQVIKQIQQQQERLLDLEWQDTIRALQTSDKEEKQNKLKKLKSLADLMK